MKFIAVRCYKCKIAQIHGANKAKKFSCKMCHEKQSVKAILGSADSARELRPGLHELNKKQCEEDMETAKNETNVDVESQMAMRRELLQREHEQLVEQQKESEVWGKFITSPCRSANEDANGSGSNANLNGEDDEDTGLVMDWGTLYSDDILHAGKSSYGPKRGKGKGKGRSRNSKPYTKSDGKSVNNSYGGKGNSYGGKTNSYASNNSYSKARGKGASYAKSANGQVNQANRYPNQSISHQFQAQEPVDIFAQRNPNQYAGASAGMIPRADVVDNKLVANADLGVKICDEDDDVIDETYDDYQFNSICVADDAVADFADEVGEAGQQDQAVVVDSEWAAFM